MITTARRTRIALVAIALTAPMVAFMAPAQADVPVLGAVSVSPATGLASEGSNLLETHGTCPAGTQGVKARLSGTGVSASSPNLVGNTQIGILSGNAYGGYELPLANTFATVLLNSGITAPNDNYVITVFCQDNSLNQYGTFTGTIHVVHAQSDGPGDGTYTTVATPTSTTTALAAPTPVDPVVAGSSVSMTATVTPSAAVGSVAFKRNGITFGTVPVTSGTATYTGTAVAAGSAPLTAVFVPTDATAFGASTSPAITGYVVAGKPVISGTTAVGRTVTCVATAGGTQAYNWYVAGTVQSVTTASVVIPASWLSKAITCRDTVTVAANSVNQTSVARTVTIGATLVVKTKPAVTGTYKVGKTLAVSHGTWSPAATTYSYQWLRNGHAISHATATKYKLVHADKGKKISCKVTAKKTGYTSGAYTTAAKKSA